MAGEINGTKVLIKKDGQTIVGQMEATLTFGGTPIDITNKSTNDWVTLLNNNLSGKQLTIAGTIIYNDNTSYKAIRTAAQTGNQDTYTVFYNAGLATDEEFSATMVPTGLSDALPMGDKVTTSITFLSSGAVAHTQPSAS